MAGTATTPGGAFNPNAEVKKATLPNQEMMGRIPYFLDQVLSQPAGALPNNSQWVLIFESFPQVILRVSEFEPGMPESWEIKKAFDRITSNDFQKTKGCMLAQSVVLPGDGAIVNLENTLSFNGLIPGKLGAGRNVPTSLRISFLETNVSFIENVIRPWIITTSHLGMVCRKGTPNDYRTNLTVFKLGIYSSSQPPIITQRYEFEGVCPISLSDEEYNYENNAVPTRSDVDFAFRHYTVSSRQNDLATLPPIAVATPA